MEYQIHVKKTYKDEPEIDDFFFVNRSEDVILRDIENDDGNFPISNNTLTEGINRYTLFLKELNSEFEIAKEELKKLKEEGVTSKEDCEECEKKISALIERITAVETLLSNVASTVGEHSTAVADIQVSLNALTEKVKMLEVNAEIAHKSLRESIANIEAPEFAPVTEEQIASLFTDDDEEQLPSNIEFVHVTEKQIASLFIEDEGRPFEGEEGTNS